jgi:transcriptional regulator with XRE-family HTH domain
MLSHFNRELDRLRGLGTEQELAARLGISDDTLVRYRRGVFPHTIRRLARFPALLAALARDSPALAKRPRARPTRRPPVAPE